MSTMACECCRGDVRYGMVPSHVHGYPSPSGQMVTSRHQVPSPCCHHAYSPSSHTHVSHQHISTPSHCHRAHNVGHNSRECCHGPGGFSHHGHQHHPVFASPHHISHSHTTPPGIQRLHCEGETRDPACHSHQFLTPQPQHTQPVYQYQRQLLTPPFLPQCHAGVGTPSQPHQNLLQQGPLSRYVQPLPAAPEHPAHHQLEISSPLGEDNMVLSTRLVPSCFVLAHPTGLCPESQPTEDQHLHSPNAASHVQTLVGSPRVPCMHQLRSQDMALSRQVNPQDTSASTLQQSQRQNKSGVLASRTALLHPPSVVVQKLPASMLPKKEETEDPLTCPEGNQTRSGTLEEGESLGDSEVHRKRRRNKERLKECCAQQIRGVEVKEAVQDVPAEDEAVLEDAFLTQPTGTKVPGSKLNRGRVQGTSGSESKVAPRRSSRLRSFTVSDDSQSDQDVRHMRPTAVRSVKTGQEKERVKEHCAQQIGGVKVEEAVLDVPAEDEAILEDALLTRPTRATGRSETKVAPRRSSRLHYFTESDDSQSEQDDEDMCPTALWSVKTRQEKERVKEHCAQQIGGVKVEEAVLDVPANDEAILEDALLTRPTRTTRRSETKAAPRRSSRLRYFTDSDESEDDENMRPTALRSVKTRQEKERVKVHCAQQIGGVKVEEAVLDVPAEDEAILEDALLTRPTRAARRSQTKVAPRRPSRLRYFTESDESQSEQDDENMRPTAVRSVKTGQEKERVKEHCAQQIGGVKVEEAVLDMPAKDEAILEDALLTRPTRATGRSETKVAPRRSSRLHYFTESDDSQSEQDVRHTRPTAVRSVKTRQKRERVEEYCAQGVKVEDAVLDVDEAILEDALLTHPTDAKVPPKSGSELDIGGKPQNLAPRRSSRLRNFTGTDDSQSDQDDGDTPSTALRSIKMIRSEEEESLRDSEMRRKRRKREHCAQQVEDEAILEDPLHTLPTGTKVPPPGKDSEKKGKRSVVLSNWYFKVVVSDSCCMVIVQGYRPGGTRLLWHSGPIVERLSLHELATRSGTVYCLRGPLDQAALAAVGINDAEIAQSFRNGFPKNWLQLIEKHAPEGKRVMVKTEDVAVCPAVCEKTMGEDVAVRPAVDKKTMGEDVAVRPAVDKKTMGEDVAVRPAVDKKTMGEDVAVCPAVDKKTMGEDVAVRPAVDKKTMGEDVAVRPAVDKKTLGGDVAVSPSVGEKARRAKVKSEPGKLKTLDLDLSAASSYLVSSFKRSSRGRTIKPSVFNMSPYINLTSEVYSYDFYGNFQGVSQVIDLTLSDNELQPHKKARSQIGKEKDSDGRADSLLTKKESQVEEPGDWEDDSPLQRVRRDDAAPLKSTMRDHSTDSCSASALPSERRKKSCRHRSIPLALTRKKVRKVVTRTETTRIYDDAVEDGQTSEEEEEAAVVRVGSKTSVQSAQNCRDKGRSLSRVSLLSSSGSESESDFCRMKVANVEVKTRSKSVQSVQKSRDKGRRRVPPKSQVNLLSSSESESEVDVVELTKPTQPELRGVDSANRTDRITRQPDTKRTARITRQPDTKKTKQNSSRPPPQDSPNRQTRKNASGAGRTNAAPQSGTQHSEWTLGDGKEGNSEYSEWTLGDGKEGDEGIPWSAEIIRDLKSIVLALPAMTTNFWERVARQLGTGHSARECSQQYLQKPLRRKHSREKLPNVTASGPPAITGGVGTMKRKRQLREALEVIDRGYNDDIFDSTPFKKKMKRVPLQEPSDDESSDEEEWVESQPIQTPREAKRRVGAPSSFTPKLCSYLTTPDLKGGMKRDAADNVMYKIQKAKKGKMPKHPSKPGAPPGKAKPLLFQHRLRNIRTGESTTLRMFEDSDDSCSDSNPFSDIEENCRDIINRLH